MIDLPSPPFHWEAWQRQAYEKRECLPCASGDEHEPAVEHCPDTGWLYCQDCVWNTKACMDIGKLWGKMEIQTHVLLRHQALDGSEKPPSLYLIGFIYKMVNPPVISLENRRNRTK